VTLQSRVFNALDDRRRRSRSTKHLNNPKKHLSNPTPTNASVALHRKRRIALIYIIKNQIRFRNEASKLDKQTLPRSVPPHSNTFFDAMQIIKLRYFPSFSVWTGFLPYFHFFRISAENMN